MATFETGNAHHSISFVVDREGEHEYVLTHCYCTFGENHYADPSDPRPARDIEIREVPSPGLAAA